MEAHIIIPHTYSEGGTIENLPIQSLQTALSGDLVRYTNNGIIQIESIVSRQRHLISGILEIKSNTIYGMGKKGGRYYLFTPSDPRYPNFVVLSRVDIQLYQTNIYAVISFLQWTGKHPQGNCEFILGAVGDYQAELRNRLYRYNLGAHDPQRNSLKKKELIAELSFKDETLLEEITKRRDFTDRKIISIDPLGCTDVDDALHYEEHSDYSILGVHIADVSYWVSPNSQIDLLAQQRITSIYTSETTLHMLPSDLSENRCSLLQNKKRLALSLLITFDPIGTITHYEFVPSVIQNKAQITYEQADILLQNGEVTLVNLAHLLKVTNSHELVEKAMILANNLCAKFLITKYGKGILRTHTDSNEKFKGPVTDEVLLKYLHTKYQNAAQYIFCSDPSKNYSHHGLQTEWYTHFTSPIRRYIDIINHRMLKDILTDDYEKVVVQANTCNKQVKRFNRDLHYFDVVKSITNEVVTNAYIVEILNREDIAVKIYIPEYQLTEVLVLCHRKLGHLLEVSITEQGCTLLTEHSVYDYNLYTKLQVHLVPIPKHQIYSRKLRIYTDNSLFENTCQ